MHRTLNPADYYKHQSEILIGLCATDVGDTPHSGDTIFKILLNKMD